MKLTFSFDRINSIDYGIHVARTLNHHNKLLFLLFQFCIYCTRINNNGINELKYSTAVLKKIKMTNKSQILYNIFQEILAASGNSSDSQSINETKILSVLREQTAKGQGNNLGSILVKVVSDAQSKLNLTIKPDPCGYCDGDFRHVIETYNGIHGYVSLLVSIYYKVFMELRHPSSFYL